MNTLRYIRKDLFGLTQQTFAAALGTSQPTVSRWELPEGHADRLAPSRDEMAAIRVLARERGIEWNDSWFFDGPLPVAGDTGVAPAGEAA